MNCHLSGDACGTGGADSGVRCSPGGGRTRGAIKESGALLEALLSFGLASLALFAAESLAARADETATPRLASVCWLATVRSRRRGAASCALTEIPVRHSNKLTATAAYNECRN